MSRANRVETRSRPSLRSAVASLLAFTVLWAACAPLFGPTASTLSGHPGFAWHSVKTAHFRLYFERESFAERHIDALKERAEQSRTRVLALLGVTDYSAQVTVFVVGSRARMKALIGKEVNGQAIPSRNVILVVVSDSIDAFSAHELCHVVAKSLWGDADDWINEGLAVYADDRWQGRALHAVANYFLGRRELVPLSVLLQRFDDRPEVVSYPEAGSFVKFLYESYGIGAIKQVWIGGAAAIPRVTGKSIDAIEREWHDRIAPRRQSNNR